MFLKSTRMLVNKGTQDREIYDKYIYYYNQELAIK